MQWLAITGSRRLRLEGGDFALTRVILNRDAPADAHERALATFGHDVDGRVN